MKYLYEAINGYTKKYINFYIKQLFTTVVALHLHEIVSLRNMYGVK